MKSEFKNLPSGWKVVRLGEICEINPSSRKLPEKFYYIDLESVEKGILHSLKEVFLETAPSRAQRLLEKGDILFQMVRPYQKNNFLFELNGDFVASTGYAQIRTKQNRDFIFHYLNFDTFTKKVIEKCTGSNYPAINTSVFSNLMILLPPLDEQEKIAEILSTWDEAINLTINLIESKKQFKKALMQNLLTAKIRFPEFQDEWRETKLKDICIKMRSGGTPKSTNRKFYNGNIPFVKINDMTLAGKYIYDTQAKITEEGLENSSAWLIPKNSLIYSMYASFGFVSINKIEVATSQAMMCIVPNLSKVALEYLYYFLDDFQKNVCSFVETGTQGNLNAEIVKNFKIKLPKLNEQQKIAEVLTSCDDEINLLNLKLENLKKQKQGLMQKLLSGKVRVK